MINNLLYSNVTGRSSVLCRSTNHLVNTYMESIYKSCPLKIKVKGLHSKSMASPKIKINAMSIKIQKTVHRHFCLTHQTQRGEKNTIDKYKVSYQRMSTDNSKLKKLLKTPCYRVIDNRRFGTTANCRDGSFFGQDNRLQKLNLRQILRTLATNSSTRTIAPVLANLGLQQTVDKYILSVRNQQMEHSPGSLRMAQEVSASIKEDLLPVTPNIIRRISLNKPMEWKPVEGNSYEHNDSNWQIHGPMDTFVSGFNLDNPDKMQHHRQLKLANRKKQHEIVRSIESNKSVYENRRIGTTPLMTVPTKKPATNDTRIMQQKRLQAEREQQKSNSPGQAGVSLALQLMRKRELKDLNSKSIGSRKVKQSSQLMSMPSKLGLKSNNATGYRPQSSVSSTPMRVTKAENTEELRLDDIMNRQRYLQEAEQQQREEKEAEAEGTEETVSKHNSKIAKKTLLNPAKTQQLPTLSSYLRSVPTHTVKTTKPMLTTGKKFDTQLSDFRKITPHGEQQPSVLEERQIAQPAPTANRMNLNLMPFTKPEKKTATNNEQTFASKGIRKFNVKPVHQKPNAPPNNSPKQHTTASIAYTERIQKQQEEVQQKHERLRQEQQKYREQQLQQQHQQKLLYNSDAVYAKSKASVMGTNGESKSPQSKGTFTKSDSQQTKKPNKVMPSATFNNVAFAKSDSKQPNNALKRMNSFSLMDVSDRITKKRATDKSAPTSQPPTKKPLKTPPKAKMPYHVITEDNRVQPTAASRFSHGPHLMRTKF